MKKPTLKSEAEYDEALKEISAYFEHPPKIGSPAAERFDRLTEAIDLYERKHWPIESSIEPRDKGRKARTRTKQG